MDECEHLKQRYPKFVINRCIGSIIFDYDSLLSKRADTPAIITDNIYRLFHGHFHIGLVIIPRPPYWTETQSRANMGRGMITRPIWKCPCIKLFITYFRHLEKRHPYWPETKSRPILTRANMGLDMEMIL